MRFTLRGDYFNGSFTHPKGLTQKDIDSSSEEIQKYSPADLMDHLWDAKIDYDNIDKVIESANAGFQIWRKTPISERINYLKKFQEVINRRQDDIAEAIALETGKPLWETKTEASAVSAKVNVTITDSLKRIQNETISEVLPNIDGHFIRKPLGPSIVIGPFNFPCHLANGQILALLLTGNSVIFKPSEKTIYSSQLLIEAFHEAGFPKGVINFINGTAHTTQNVLKHESIRGIFFTGSYAVGKKILESVGADVTKLVALELGGKNTTIIHKDTDIDHALPELLRSCFLSSGQRCTSTSMIAVHKDIQQEFINKFVELAKRIIVDHPIEFENLPFMGPIIDQHAVNLYKNYCNLGLNNGAEELLSPQELKLTHQGHYVSPVIHFLKEVKKSNPFTQEEIFAPATTFTTYTDIEDAIRIANISDYGLAASVFTQDKNIYKLCLEDIDAGIINLNRSTVGASSRLPFGGVKNSGNYHPSAVTMVDSCVTLISSLETQDNSSKIEDVKGLR